MDSQIMQYVPVLLLALFAAALHSQPGDSVLFGYRAKHSRSKDMAYECGMIRSARGTRACP